VSDWPKLWGCPVDQMVGTLDEAARHQAKTGHICIELSDEESAHVRDGWKHIDRLNPDGSYREDEKQNAATRLWRMFKG
jgi:hypothetical protein